MAILKRSDHKLKDVWSYLTGHYRYFFFVKYKYENKPWAKRFIRKHIRQQIKTRLVAMRPECYSTGSCVVCGCATPALQMASKPCEGNCYPELMSKKNWKKFLKYNHVRN